MIKNKKISNKINYSLRLGMMAFILFFAAFGVQAQNQEVEESVGVNFSCQPETKKFLDEETKAYETYLSKTLQNKKSATNLFDLANQRYLLYRAKLLNYRGSLPYSPLIKDPLSALNDVGVCQTMIDKYLTAAAAFQKRALIGNAQRKSTIRLTERMNNINAKLDTLNRNVAGVKAGVQIFVQKVPCYVEKCPPS